MQLIPRSYFPAKFVHEGDGEEEAGNGGSRRQETVDEHFRGRITQRCAYGYRVTWVTNTNDRALQKNKRATLRNTRKTRKFSSITVTFLHSYRIIFFFFKKFKTREKGYQHVADTCATCDFARFLRHYLLLRVLTEIDIRLVKQYFSISLINFLNFPF